MCLTPRREQRKIFGILEPSWLGVARTGSQAWRRAPDLVRPSFPSGRSDGEQPRTNSLRVMRWPRVTTVLRGGFHVVSRVWGSQRSIPSQLMGRDQIPSVRKYRQAEHFPAQNTLDQSARLLCWNLPLEALQPVDVWASRPPRRISNRSPITTHCEYQ